MDLVAHLFHNSLLLCKLFCFELFDYNVSNQTLYHEQYSINKEYKRKKPKHSFFLFSNVLSCVFPAKEWNTVSKLLPICFQTIMIVWCLLLKHCAKLSASTEATHLWQFVSCFGLQHFLYFYVFSGILNIIMAFRLR